MLSSPAPSPSGPVTSLVWQSRADTTYKQFLVPLLLSSACRLRKCKGAVGCRFPVTGLGVSEFHCFVHNLCCQILLRQQSKTLSVQVAHIPLCHLQAVALAVASPGWLANWILVVVSCLAPQLIYPKSFQFFVSSYWTQAFMRSTKNVWCKFSELFACINSSYFLCESVIRCLAYTCILAVFRKIISIINEHTHVILFKLVSCITKTVFSMQHWYFH